MCSFYSSFGWCRNDGLGVLWRSKCETKHENRLNGATTHHQRPIELFGFCFGLVVIDLWRPVLLRDLWMCRRWVRAVAVDCWQLSLCSRRIIRIASFDELKTTSFHLTHYTVYTLRSAHIERKANRTKWIDHSSLSVCVFLRSQTQLLHAAHDRRTLWPNLSFSFFQTESIWWRLVMRCAFLKLYEKRFLLPL